jgi:hypothetical protein
MVTVITNRTAKIIAITDTIDRTKGYRLYAKVLNGFKNAFSAPGGLFAPVSGRKRTTNTKITAARMALAAKVQRHPAYWMITPPMAGPIVGPRVRPSC